MTEQGVPPGFDVDSWEKLSPEVKALIVGITEAFKVEVASIHTRLNYLYTSLDGLSDRVDRLETAKDESSIHTRLNYLGESMETLGDKIHDLQCHHATTAANNMHLMNESTKAVEGLQNAHKKLTLYLLRQDAIRSVLDPITPPEDEFLYDELADKTLKRENDELEDLSSLFG